MEAPSSLQLLEVFKALPEWFPLDMGGSRVKVGKFEFGWFDILVESFHNILTFQRGRSDLLDGSVPTRRFTTFLFASLQINTHNREM